METARYIGLFLIKNQYCYIHGLGNMELLKRPATHDGSKLQAPSYEVKLTQGGSIDDNLANFIATNEQISISKAANALREFSIQARTDLAAGKEVPIPNMGKFIEENGLIKFVTDEAFSYTPVGIPTIKNSKQLDEQNAKPAHKPSFPPPSKADSINWSMVILAAVLLVIIGGGGYGVYYYMNREKKTSTEEAPAIVKDTVKPVAQPVVPDTALVHKDTLAAMQPQVADSIPVSYKMVIGDYPTRARADKRQASLLLNGTHTDVLPKDSTNFLIIATLNCRAKDTVHVKDSLSRMFGFKGVAVFR